MNRRKSIFLGIASLGLAAGLGYAVRAFASGIPATNALSYAGVLEDATGAITGSHNIQVILYDAATAGNNLCQSLPSALDIQDGHFSVQLPDACTTAVGANPNVWADVLVDGSDTGRTKIGAVPYAVEANHAVSADSLTGPSLVPSGAVMAFNLSACPSGWSALAAAANHVIVGVGSGLTLGTAVGSDQLILTEAQMPAHTHSATDSGHTHPQPGGTDAYVVNEYPGTCSQSFAVNGTIITGGPSGSVCSATNTGTGYSSISVGSAGSGDAFDNRQASLPLLYCQKN